MRFHYRLLLLTSVLIAISIVLAAHGPQSFLALLNPHPSDPFGLADADNRQIARELEDTARQLEAGVRSLTPVPAWLQDARQGIAAAQDTTDDQRRQLERLADREAGRSERATSDVIAALVAMLGTLSAVVLSWRKDVREARADAAKAQSARAQLFVP